MTKDSIKEVQHGGGHYKSMKIQPVEYVHANGIGALEFEAIKYLSRHGRKGKAEDVKKALHFCQMLLRLEYGIESSVDYQSEFEGTPEKDERIDKVLEETEGVDLTYRNGGNPYPHVIPAEVVDQQGRTHTLKGVTESVLIRRLQEMLKGTIPFSLTIRILHHSNETINAKLKEVDDGGLFLEGDLLVPWNSVAHIYIIW